MEGFKEWYKIIDENISPVKKLFNSFYEGGAILDIGGNVGAFTDYVINIHPEVKVYMFEPVKKFKDYLTKKYENTNVTFIPYGVSNRQTTSKIRLNNSNLGFNEIVDGEGNDLEIIELVTLDDYISENIKDRIGFIKMDIENHEPFAFEGLKNYIKTSSELPIIVFEHNYNSPHASKQDEVFKWLFQYYSEFDYKKVLNTQDITLFPKK